MFLFNFESFDTKKKMVSSNKSEFRKFNLLYTVIIGTAKENVHEKARNGWLYIVCINQRKILGFDQIVVKIILT